MCRNKFNIDNVVNYLNYSIVYWRNTWLKQARRILYVVSSEYS